MQGPVTDKNQIMFKIFMIVKCIMYIKSVAIVPMIPVHLVQSEIFGECQHFVL